MKLAQDFKRSIEDLIDQSTNPRLLLAISGGLDSMVLLNLCCKFRFNVAVAHCNFKLRGEDSLLDAKLVRETCADLRIDYYEKSFDTKSFACERKISIEMAARKLRYDWFEEIMNENQFQYLLTAHHQNDQIETFFINLNRGTGIRGLAGMPNLRRKIFRPLLFATKQDLKDYSVQEKIIYRDDYSNFQNIYLRNQFRNEIIPVLEKMNPSFLRNISQTMEYIGDTVSFIDDQINKLSKNICTYKDGNLSLFLPALRKEPSAKFILYEILRPYNFKRDQITHIFDHLNSQSGKQFFSSTHRIFIHQNHFVVTEIKEKITDLVYEIGQMETTINFPVQLEINRITKNNWKIENSQSAYLDYGKLEFPLKLRPWRMGDYFHPLGMKGRKKVSDFFIDEKWSLSEKENAWLIESGNNIVWIVGSRIDDRYRVDEKTSIVYAISLKLET